MVCFSVRGVGGSMADCLLIVGGQRSERKKWIHCFEDVREVASSFFQKLTLARLCTGQCKESRNTLGSQAD